MSSITLWISSPDTDIHLRYILSNKCVIQLFLSNLGTVYLELIFSILAVWGLKDYFMRSSSKVVKNLHKPHLKLSFWSIYLDMKIFATFFISWADTSIYPWTEFVEMDHQANINIMKIETRLGIIQWLHKKKNKKKTEF
jgi:hypothetical protein